MIVSGALCESLCSHANVPVSVSVFVRIFPTNSCMKNVKQLNGKAMKVVKNCCETRWHSLKLQTEKRFVC